MYKEMFCFFSLGYKKQKDTNDEEERMKKTENRCAKYQKTTISIITSLNTFPIIHQAAAATTTSNNTNQ